MIPVLCSFSDGRCRPFWARKTGRFSILTRSVFWRRYDRRLHVRRRPQQRVWVSVTVLVGWVMEGVRVGLDISVASVSSYKPGYLYDDSTRVKPSATGLLVLFLFDSGWMNNFGTDQISFWLYYIRDKNLNIYLNSLSSTWSLCVSSCSLHFANKKSIVQLARLFSPSSVVPNQLLKIQINAANN